MSAFSSFRRAIKRAKWKIQALSALGQILAQRNQWTCLAVHVRKFGNLPAFLLIPLVCGRVKGKLSCPPELTILLIHNYKSVPLMEKCLRYVGIREFTALKPVHKGPWFNSLKLMELKKFLDSGSCTSKYILYCDSDDAVIRDDPRKAIQYLEEEGCGMLLSSNNYAGGYECMPEARTWADRNAAENGCAQRYLNTGVYVVKTEYLREVVNAALEYVTDHDLPREEFVRLRRNGSLCQRLPEFPKGIGCDQVILRFLHPRLYPRMKIDYKGRLALR